eukprot:3785500-Pyramimonas_sp.AAC.1
MRSLRRALELRSTQRRWPRIALYISPDPRGMGKPCTAGQVPQHSRQNALESTSGINERSHRKLGTTCDEVVEANWEYSGATFWRSR